MITADFAAKIKVIVAIHKQYEVPSDRMYYPLRVGAACVREKEKQAVPGIPGDDTGENISKKNPVYSELTGLYWAWKNLEADYCGLAHYRRFLSGKDGILTEKECRGYFENEGYRVLLPKKQHYFIETLYSHYQHTHYEEHLVKTREVMSSHAPDYLDIYDQVMQRTSGYMFNMFIMERELLDAYCAWLFDILFALEKKVSVGGLSGYHARYAGRVSEILFNVWLEYQIESGVVERDEIRELPIYYSEKINWWKKGRSFLAAKFLGKKYEGSF